MATTKKPAAKKTAASRKSSAKAKAPRSKAKSRSTKSPKERKSSKAKGAPKEPKVLELRPAPQVDFETKFRRNPKAPSFYAPLIEVRTTPNAFHLLCYVPPAADAQDLIEEDGKMVLEVRARNEVILPPETVGPLLHNLAVQYREFLSQRLHAEAAEQGVEVGDLHFDGLDELIAATGG